MYWCSHISPPCFLRRFVLSGKTVTNFQVEYSVCVCLNAPSGKVSLYFLVVIWVMAFLHSDHSLLPSRPCCGHANFDFSPIFFYSFYISYYLWLWFHLLMPYRICIALVETVWLCWLAPGLCLEISVSCPSGSYLSVKPLRVSIHWQWKYLICILFCSIYSSFPDVI